MTTAAQRNPDLLAEARAGVVAADELDPVALAAVQSPQPNERQAGPQSTTRTTHRPATRRRVSQPRRPAATEVPS
jgi:hypothetical protein